MAWKPAGNRGRFAAVALVAAAACVGAVLFASEVSRPTALEACTPCTSGEGCVAGCLSPAVELRIAEAHKRAADVRLQQLSDQNTAIPQYADVLHSSLHDQENAIEQRNKELLQLRNSQTQAQQGLGGVLNAALKQVVRAEAAEVKLRRQAELTKGASVASVFTSLRYSKKLQLVLFAKKLGISGTQSINLSYTGLHVRSWLLLLLLPVAFLLSCDSASLPQRHPTSLIIIRSLNLSTRGFRH